MLTALRRRRRQRGQVALETLVVLVPWLVVTTMFFNLFYFMGSAMLAQSIVNRMAMQISALGCTTPAIMNQVSDEDRLGISNVQAHAVFVNTPTTGNGAGFLPSTVFSSGQINGDGAVPFCVDAAQLASGNQPPKVAAGDYIIVYVSYTQNLALFRGINSAHSAVVVSNDLQGIGRQ
jgi:hypothetical protein